MKNRFTTGTERSVPADAYLVSKTDLAGKITYANDAFVAISGYSREELQGQPHNIVRHPDMPAVAFADLWKTLKAGFPWRGLVKNRAKDGSFYWVEASVVPVKENGETVGYMSVRKAPTRDAIQAAEQLYAQLNRTKKPIPGGVAWWQRVSLRARIWGVFGVLMVMLLIGGALGLGGIHQANKDLATMYRAELMPAKELSQVMAALADDRAQVLLALQHDQRHAAAALHEHGVDSHFARVRDNAAAIEQALGKLSAGIATTADPAITEGVAAFKQAQEAYHAEGIQPTLAAVGSGQYDEASRLLLQQVNPLHAALKKDGESLLAALLAASEARYLQAETRFDQVLLLASLGTFAALFLVVIGGIAFTRGVVGPIRRVINYFSAIAEGRLTETIDISGRDEPGILMCGLAEMQVHLKVMLDEIAAASRAIAKKSGDLHAQMDLVAQQSVRQHDNVQSVAAATEEFSQSVAEVASSAEATANAAFSSQALVTSSNAKIGKSMEATEKVVATVQASSDTITALNTSIQRIGEITQVIREIANQTNLLALNAAIEAARAGEHGRGFAVVADEVRKLAERTAVSTADISAMVGDIQSGTQKAVASMHHAADEVSSGIGMLQDSVAGLADITVASEQVATMAQQISEAAQQQNLASMEVAGNMEHISQLIEQNTESAGTAQSAATELRNTAAALDKLLKRFKLHDKA